MKKLGVFLILLIILATTLQAHREEVYYLQGKVGNRRIFVEIDEYGENCMLRYFNSESYFDRVMEGVITDENQFIFQAFVWNEERNRRVKTDSLLLFESTMNVWEGTFFAADGTVQEVRLRPIVLDSMQHPYYDYIQKERIAPYDAMKTMHVNFERVKRFRAARGIKAEKVIDRASGIEGLRILPGKRPVQVDSINSLLLVEQIKNIIAFYRCVYLGERGDYSVKYSLSYINEHVISYQFTINSKCYGGPSQKEVVYKNMALSDASPLLLDRIYWFDGQQLEYLSEGEYRWTQYRYNVFGPKVFSYLNEHYPQKVKTDINDPCNFNTMKIWYFPDWYFSKKGLVLSSKAQLTNFQCKENPQMVLSYEFLETYNVSDWKF